MWGKDMIYNHLTVTLVRILGLIILSFSIIKLPEYIVSFIGYKDIGLFEALITSVFPFLIPTILGLIFLFYPSSKIKDCTTIENDEYNYIELGKLLIVLLGIYLMIDAIFSILFFALTESNNRSAYLVSNTFLFFSGLFLNIKPHIFLRD